VYLLRRPEWHSQVEGREIDAILGLKKKNDKDLSGFEVSDTNQELHNSGIISHCCAQRIVHFLASDLQCM